ncbi:uncharacterized protein TrAtP1_005446 [Trichoderma atroviride]|uniref:uncharacterized protein n=1 Tax=Hypocrea atroviridis TaxID=63577 RepID=UPI003317B73F|nr:hypothetical protein TrAtP1_005446 [Trichoderma atroviride]
MAVSTSCQAKVDNSWVTASLLCPFTSCTAYCHHSEFRAGLGFHKNCNVESVLLSPAEDHLTPGRVAAMAESRGHLPFRRPALLTNPEQTSSSAKKMLLTADASLSPARAG